MCQRIGRARISYEQWPRGCYLIRTTLNPTCRSRSKASIDISPPDAAGHSIVMSVIPRRKTSAPRDGDWPTTAPTVPPEPRRRDDATHRRSSLVGDGSGSSSRSSTTAAALDMGDRVSRPRLEAPVDSHANGMGRRGGAKGGPEKDTWCGGSTPVLKGSMNGNLERWTTSPKQTSVTAKLIQQVGVTRTVDIAAQAGHCGPTQHPHRPRYNPDTTGETLADSSNAEHRFVQRSAPSS